MHRLIATWACLGLIAVVAAHGGDNKGISIDGTWVFSKVISKGKQVPDADLAKVAPTVVFKEGKYTASVMGKVQETGTYKVDATKNPATMDMVPADGKDRGKKELAILKLEGDTLTIAIADAGDPNRPKSFEPAKDVEIQTLKRKK
jgi:uncharacterized protein (TIGR03067 family)